MEHQLQLEVNAFRECAWSNNTKRTYSVHRRTYIKFCLLLQTPPCPVEQKTICLFIAWLARRLKYNSIKQYLNIIRIIHQENNYPNPLESNYHVNMTLRGVRRTLGDTVCPKIPITPMLLLYIKERLDLSTPHHAAVWAGALLMFYGLLRKSNVFSPPGGHTPDIHLSRKDLIFNESGLTLVIRWSKTNQFRSTIHRAALPRVRGHPLCPTRAMYQLISLTPNTSIS